MKKAIYYKKAAERIANRKNDFCCDALKRAMGLSRLANSEDVPLFYELYYEERLTTCSWFGFSDYPESRDFRVIALLLCYWIAKSENN